MPRVTRLLASWFHAEPAAAERMLAKRDAEGWADPTRATRPPKSKIEPELNRGAPR